MSKVRVAWADRVDEIDWDNIGLPTSYRVCRRFITVVAGSAILVLNFAILVFVWSSKNNELSAKNAVIWRQYVFSLAAAASVIITNEAGSNGLRYFAAEERHPTQTEILKARFKVITVFKFVNSAIAPMAASFFTLADFNNQLRAGGLLDDVSIVVLYYALVH